MPVKFRPPNRARRSAPAMLVAPTGGLNGRDSYSSMPHEDAFILDNWFPHNTSVDTRGGTLNSTTGLPGPVESLEVYTGATSVMLGFANGAIYDVSAPGPVGVPYVSGRNGNRVTTTMFSNALTQWLLIFSGLDEPLAFNGVATAPLNITGVVGGQNSMHSPHTFKGRVFIAQEDQLGFYYLDVGAIQGPAHYFDLSQVSLKGGVLATITSFSMGDTGTGPQDYALFVTTEGEYILYGGIDPSNSATWELVGRYYGPPPIGKKGWLRFRSDVYFITEEGVMAFAQIRQSGEGNKGDEYITAKLGRHYTDGTKYQNVHGWCGLIYPRGQMLIVNMPTTGAISGEYQQFAMNTSTNAWGRFTKQPALDWALFNRRAYFSTFDGRVILSDEGVTDNGLEVKGVCRQAWNTFDNDQNIGVMDKQFHMASLAMQVDGIPGIACGINVNFETEQPIVISTISPPQGAIWNVAAWNEDYWAGAAVTQNIFVPVGRIGYIASLWLEAASLSSKIHWFASRILMEQTKRASI